MEITFPDNYTVTHKRHRVIIYLAKLVRFSGWNSLLLVFLAVFFVRPALSLQVSRRLEYSKLVVSHCREMTKIIGSKISVIPDLLVSYKTSLKSDAMTQTGEEHSPFSKSSDEICEKLERLTTSLKSLQVPTYETSIESLMPMAYTSSEIQPLRYQIKQFDSFCSMLSLNYSPDGFFRQRNSRESLKKLIFDHLRPQ